MEVSVLSDSQSLYYWIEIVRMMIEATLYPGWIRLNE